MALYTRYAASFLSNAWPGAARGIEPTAEINDSAYEFSEINISVFRGLVLLHVLGLNSSNGCLSSRKQIKNPGLSSKYYWVEKTAFN